jgi:hypothetical protein
MKKAAPVATAGIQSTKNVAKDGLDAGSVTLGGAGPSRPGAASKQADQARRGRPIPRIATSAVTRHVSREQYVDVAAGGGQEMALKGRLRAV